MPGSPAGRLKDLSHSGSRGEGVMSAGYRFYLLNEGDHIVAVQTCDCPSDADALLEARAALQASEYPAIEVWSRAHCVGLLRKPTQK